MTQGRATIEEFKTTLRELDPEDREEFDTLLRELEAVFDRMGPEKSRQFRPRDRGGNPSEHLSPADLNPLIWVLDAHQ
jgi:hypothetical protein